MEENVSKELTKYLIQDVSNIVIKYIPFIDPKMVSRINYYYRNCHQFGITATYEKDTKRESEDLFGKPRGLFPEIIYLLFYKEMETEVEMAEDKYYIVQLKDGRFARINIYNKDVYDGIENRMNIHYSNKIPLMKLTNKNENFILDFFK